MPSNSSFSPPGETTKNTKKGKKSKRNDLRQSQFGVPTLSSGDLDVSTDSLDTSTSSIQSSGSLSASDKLVQSNGSISKGRRRNINISNSSTTSNSSFTITKGRSEDKGIGSDHEGNYFEEIPEMDDLSIRDPYDDEDDFYDEEDDDSDIDGYIEQASRDRSYTNLVTKLSSANAKINKFKQQIATMRKESSKRSSNNSKKYNKDRYNNNPKNMKKSKQTRSIDHLPDSTSIVHQREWGIDAKSGEVKESNVKVVSEIEPTAPISDMTRSRSWSTLTALHEKKSCDELFTQLYNNTLYSDINLPDERGHYPIHLFIIDGHLNQVKDLITNGASMESKDPNGNTPLLLALHNNHRDIAQLLVDWGASINVSDHNGNTPLVLACTHNYFDIAERLIQLGAEVNVSSATGNSPLMLACQHRYTYDLVSVLIGRGADVNAKNRYGDTCLLSASALGHIELVILLLESKADVTTNDRNGNTPLHKAASKGHKDIVEILVEKGADLRAKNLHGNTALEVAATPQIRKVLEDYDPGVKSWKWEIEYSKLKIHDMPIGEGKFSICYSGSLHGTPVAVKVLKVTSLNDHVIQSFNHEVGIMSDIKHPNLLVFLGACFHNPHLCIITEYLPMGSLRNFIERNTLRWSQLLKFAITTARGMAWLHSRAPVVLHRDLHSNNILVTENLECKVADLGLSQIQGQRHLSSSMYKRIIPPEILKGEIWTKKSDVFSYGLILYELLTSKKADTTTIKQISVLYDDNEPGKHGYIELIKACTSSNPEKRPHFEDILVVLDMLQEKDVNHQREIRLQSTAVEIKGEYV